MQRSLTVIPQHSSYRSRSLHYPMWLILNIHSEHLTITRSDYNLPEKGTETEELRYLIIDPLEYDSQSMWSSNVDGNDHLCQSLTASPLSPGLYLSR